ncbi:NTP transferase domain-containing protein [Bacillus sp. V59.32b]|uniref:nucleotidyltransferase family protein n=1 Tax=Bacillus sp. V59.32b TaxID=1758642 RepID=UPI000E3BACCC|nr:nucleotidyltransferase family protein [Bacillus sp. V59.32b]RFU69629.1 nucleotidyltransferase family protein [Bacillus sp. V59.32b]
MNNKVWGIILAAGFSRRMGTAKLLLPFKGKSILLHVIEQSLHSNLSGITVVVNPEVPDLITQASVPGIDKLILNEKAVQGMSTSIKSGLVSVPADTSAVVFLLGDMPLITYREINRVIQDYLTQDESPLIVQSSYKNLNGHPVLFNRRLFSELYQVCGDEGARSVIKKYKHHIYYSRMGTNMAFDIDTKIDYQKLLREEVC